MRLVIVPLESLKKTQGYILREPFIDIQPKAAPYKPGKLGLNSEHANSPVISASVDEDEPR